MRLPLNPAVADSDYSDERLGLLQGRTNRKREARQRSAPHAGETATMAAARMRREQRRRWEHPDASYFEEWRVAKRDGFRQQLARERDESDSEASLPSTTWDSAHEGPDSPGVNRKPFDIDALDQAMFRTDRYVHRRNHLGPHTQCLAYLRCV